MKRTLRNVRLVWRIAITDIARWARVPSLIAATLIPALGMGITVLALTYAVGRQPVALVQMDHSPQAEKVVNAIRENDGFFLVERTPEQAARDLRQQRVAGVITIPQAFTRDIYARGAKIDVLINNVDLDFADDIRRSVSDAAVVTNLDSADNDAADAAEVAAPATPANEPKAEAEEADLQGFGEPGVYNPYHVGLVEKDLRKGDTEFLDYQLVPVLALLALTTGALVTALGIAGDRESGALRILALSPVGRAGVVLGRLLGGTLAASAVLAVVSVPLALRGSLHPPQGRWPVVALLLFLTGVGSTGLGVLIGMLTRRVATAVMLGVNAVAASFLLGGGFTTVAFLPAWVQRLSHFTPTYYAVDGLRQAMFYTAMPTVPTDLVVLAGTAAVSVVVGAVVLAARPAAT
jgi:ABC-2 type transport system permease protein